MFNILAILFGLLITPAQAQNTTCATRPLGDNSNACASTAFVHNTKLQQTLSVFDFGAACDGLTDDTIAIQKTINAAVASGRKVRLCEGVSVISGSGLSVVNTGAGSSGGSNSVSLRLTIAGAGASASILKWIGSSSNTPLTITSGQGPVLFAGFSVQNASASQVGIGIALNQSNNISFDSIGVYGFQYGIKAIDNFSVRISRSIINNNKYGVYAAYSSITRPNNWMIEKSTINSNSSIGLWFVAPDNLIVLGNTIELNGSGNVGDSGLYIQGGFADGVKSASITGNYIQGTNGSADVYVNVDNGNPATVDITGNDFTRTSATAFAYNNIFFNRGTATITALVAANAFGAYNGYVPNASRRDIDVSGGAPSDSGYQLVSLANFYYSATDAPASSLFKAVINGDGSTYLTGVALSSLATQAPYSIVANGSGSTAVPTAVASNSTVMTALASAANAPGGFMTYGGSACAALTDCTTGTWTPTLTFGGGSTGLSYGTNAGYYVKIGKLVFFRFITQLTAVGSSTGAAQIGSLPLTSSNDAAIGEARLVSYSNMASMTSPTAYVISNGTGIVLNQYGATGVVAMTNSNFTSSSVIYGAGMYQIP